ncbi:MAG TPA: NMD3-related protein [Candidatus Nanoarchaeia archaeon]|nr:NMD3-related protein [Candidatus Nanoarchaeia archaeon]
MVKPIHGKNSEYFEAILQLRNVADEVIDFVNKEISKKHIPLAKVKKVTNGHDYYLGNSNLTRNLGKTLQEKYGGEFTVTATLFTRKEGRPVYRLTVLFRAIPFKKGDQVEYHEELYNVIMSGKKVMLQNAKTGKKVQVWHKDMKKVKKKE